MLFSLLQDLQNYFVKLTLLGLRCV